MISDSSHHSHSHKITKGLKFSLISLFATHNMKWGGKSRTSELAANVVSTIDSLATALKNSKDRNQGV